MTAPERQAREKIDRLLMAAGWHVCDAAQKNIKSVTPDAKDKDHFVIVDAIGVCEQDMTDSRLMEQKPIVSIEKHIQAIASAIPKRRPPHLVRRPPRPHGTPHKHRRLPAHLPSTLQRL